MQTDIRSQIQSALGQMTKEQQAEILRQILDPSDDIAVLGPMDLTTAKSINDPMEIGAFRSLLVIDATDSDVTINFRPNTKAAYMGTVPLKKNFGVNSTSGFAKGYLHWDAQSGKTVTLILSKRAQITSGQFLSVNSGGVSISDGSSFTRTVVSLGAGTQTAILASSSTRKIGVFYNDTGASIWVGESTVTNAGATKGEEVLPGEKYYWRNTAALYGYVVAATSISVRSEA